MPGGGGVRCRANSSPYIFDCVFEYNWSTDGGAVTLEESSPTFERCVFRSNYTEGLGGAVAGTLGSSPIFRSCIFSGNSSQSGGAVYCASYAFPYFEDCTFVGNTASSRGGALAAFSASPLILGCTFFQNGSPEGGAICFWNGTLDILQTIIVGSIEGPSIFCGPSSMVSLACCDIYGNAGGDWIDPFADQFGVNGNISSDPMFCDPSAEELTLWEDSPCAPFSPSNPECDLIGAWPVQCTSQAAPDGRSRERVWLAAGRPSPFIDRMRFGFYVPPEMAGVAGVTGVHDAAGRNLRRLGVGPWAAGMHWIEWNGCDDSGRPVPSGVYYLRLDCGRIQASQRVLRLQ